MRDPRGCIQRNGVVVLVSVALLSVAGIVAAYLFTRRPEPEPVDPYKQAHAAEIACLQGGGSWVAGKNADGVAILGGGYCDHSEPATAPSTSDSGSSASTIAEQVDATYSIAEQRAFCVSAHGLGYTTARRIWKAQGNQDVFDELWARCLAY